MSELIKCERCGTPIAAGHLEAGELRIRCHRCGHKTLLIPELKRSDIVALKQAH